MKALVLDAIQSLSIRDAPRPEPGVDEQLIRVEAVGICGSDMHAYLGHDIRRPAPLILGHEAAGTIVGGNRDGTRVAINPLVSCGTCPACASARENLCPTRQIISMPPRPGAFAQFVAMPNRNLIEVPAHVPFAKAALAEPLAVSWHAVRLALAVLHPNSARRALVIGGGAIGLGASLALKAMGIEDVTLSEPNKARRELLETQCQETVVATVDQTFPIVIDAVGLSATRALASEMTEPGGVIIHVGLGEDTGGLNIRRMTLQEITFLGTYTYTAQDFHETAQAIFDGRLGALDWYEPRAMSDGPSTFKDLLASSVAAPKIVLAPWA